MADDQKVNITFNETRVVDDHRKGTPDEQKFEAGKTYALSPRSADRWVKRGAAEWASDEDRAQAAGASSDVALNLHDPDRHDTAKVADAASHGTGTATAEGSSGASSEPQPTDYSDMKVADLKVEVEKRGLEKGDASTKADLIKLLERDDTVNAAIANREFDVLHVDELKAYAERENIDLTGRVTKADIVDAVAGTGARA